MKKKLNKCKEKCKVIFLILRLLLKIVAPNIGK